MEGNRYSMQNRISFHTLTYWNAFAQCAFYILAIAYLLRTFGNRGFWHATRVAVTKSGS